MEMLLVVGLLITLPAIVLVDSHWFLLAAIAAAQFGGDVLPPIAAVGNVDLRLYDVFFVASLLKLSITKILRKNGLKISKNLPFLWYFLWVAMVTAFSPFFYKYSDPVSQLVAFVRFLSGAVLVWVIPSIFNTKNKIMVLEVVIILLAVMQVVLTPFFVFDKPIGDIGRISGVTTPPEFAAYMFLVLAVTVGSEVFSRHAILRLMVASCFLVCVVISQTRAALLAILVFFFLSVFKRKNQIIYTFVKRPALSCFVVILLPFVIFVVSRPLVDRVENESELLYTEEGGSAFERLELASAGFSLAMESPLIGYGYSSFRLWRGEVQERISIISASKLTVITEPHSGWIQIFHDGGLIGLALYCVAWLKLILERSRQCKSAFFLQAWGGGIGVWLFFGQLLPGTLANISVWLGFGLLSAHLRLNAKHQQVNQE